MQATVQKISPVLVELSVEVPAEAVKLEVDKAYSNLAKKAHVRGFRPGKAPRNVLTQLFGSQVHNDVARTIVDSTLPQVLTEKKVTPVTRPTVEPGKVSMTEAFSYKARFEVQPEIEEVKYEDFELVRPALQATENMVQEQLESLRQRHASLKAPEPGRPAQAHDVLTIDFTVSVDGQEVKDAGGQGVQIELGTGQALPELDAGLMGKSVGELVRCELVFPDSHPNAALRGKRGTFHITIADLKERILPELDDEFAKDLGQFQTLVELRADVHSRLEVVLKDQVEAALAQQMIVQLNEKNPLEVPPSLVEQQFRALEQEVLAQARRMGRRITADQLKGMGGAIREDAQRKVRAGILMAAIAKKHEVKVSEADIEKAYVELAQQSGKNVAKVKAEYREPGQRDVLLSLIIEDKVLDIIESKAKITDGPTTEVTAKEGTEPSVGLQTESEPAREGNLPARESGAGESLGAKSESAPPDESKTVPAPAGVSEKMARKKKGVEG
jgi:trigger factor